MQLWTELLCPGSPYATRDASSNQTSTTSSQRSSSIPASDPDVNGTLTESSYTVISDEGSPDMVPMNAAAALAPSDGSSHHPQEAPPLQQQQQQEEEVVEEEEEVPSGEPVPPLGERGEGSVLPPVPPIPPVPPVLPPVAPPVPPHLMNCEAMIKAVTQYERFARGRHGVEEVPWALVREGKRGGSFQEFSQGKKREGASQAGPAEGKEGAAYGDACKGAGYGGACKGAAYGGACKAHSLQARALARNASTFGLSNPHSLPSPQFPPSRLLSSQVPPKPLSSLHSKFLYATFVPQSKYGIGAQLTNVAGALALAVASGRVLVLAKFPRAMHGGCEGRKHSRWHCFFAPETSDACRRRAHDLMAKQQSQNPATAEPESNLRAKSNLPAKSDVHSSLPVVRQQDIPGELVWFPPVPALWGEPWLRIPAVIDINGHMQQTTKTGNKDCWWRAQAWRFLMRSPSRYLCAVINRARHAAFGPMAARHVAHTEAAILQAEKLGFAASTLLSGTNQLSAGYPLLDSSQSSLFQSSHPKSNKGVQSGTSESNYSQGVLLDTISVPWVPRPIVSMHVRMGDKAKEMRVAGFGTYLHLLSRVRQFDPSATTVWLSTEMQPPMPAGAASSVARLRPFCVPVLLQVALSSLIPLAFPDVWRTLRFWDRLMPIYMGYMKTKLAVRKKPIEVRHEKWAVRHEWGGKLVHDLVLRLSGLYVKSAQILASKSDFMPAAWVRRLSALFDNVPPRPYSQVIRSIQCELAISASIKPATADIPPSQSKSTQVKHRALLVADMFESIDEESLASASIAQAHAAVLLHPLPENHPTDPTKVLPILPHLTSKERDALGIAAECTEACFLANTDRLWPIGVMTADGTIQPISPAGPALPSPSSGVTAAGETGAAGAMLKRPIPPRLANDRTEEGEREEEGEEEQFFDGEGGESGESGDERDDFFDAHSEAHELGADVASGSHVAACEGREGGATGAAEGGAGEEGGNEEEKQRERERERERELERERQRGRAVVVKVQHLGMDIIMRSDLRNIGRVAEFLSPQLPFDLRNIVKEIQQTIPNEFNFQREAAFMTTVRHNLACRGFHQVVCPTPVLSLCTRRMIVMERLYGTPFTKLIDSLHPYKDSSLLPPRLAAMRLEAISAIRSLLESYGAMFFLDGVFHADPHPGNLLLLPGAKLGLLDFGQSKVLERQTKRSFARMVVALCKGNQLEIALALLGTGISFGGEADWTTFFSKPVEESTGARAGAEEGGKDGKVGGEAVKVEPMMNGHVSESAQCNGLATVNSVAAPASAPAHAAPAPAGLGLVPAGSSSATSPAVAAGGSPVLHGVEGGTVSAAVLAAVVAFTENAPPDDAPAAATTAAAPAAVAAAAGVSEKGGEESSSSKAGAGRGESDGESVLATLLKEVGPAGLLAAATPQRLQTVQTLSYLMFDTRPMAEAQTSPLAQESVLQKAPLKAFNQSYWLGHAAAAETVVPTLLAGRVIQFPFALPHPPFYSPSFHIHLYQIVRAMLLLRGLCHSLDADISAVQLWRPYAEALLAQDP
ncbi:unnamed protein product [Closterium sp. Naga37s-1]|nr:unnamed protein product [Closterium sp. Naga37s-1]